MPCTEHENKKKRKTLSNLNMTDINHLLEQKWQINLEGTGTGSAYYHTSILYYELNRTKRYVWLTASSTNVSRVLKITILHNICTSMASYLRPPRLRLTIFEHGFRMPTTLVSDGVPRPYTVRSLIVRMEGDINSFFIIKIENVI